MLPKSHNSQRTHHLGEGIEIFGAIHQFFLWMVCFFGQFFRSVLKVDYLTLRHGFIIMSNLTSDLGFTEFEPGSCCFTKFNSFLFGKSEMGSYGKLAGRVLETEMPIMVQSLDLFQDLRWDCCTFSCKNSPEELWNFVTNNIAKQPLTKTFLQSMC